MFAKLFSNSFILCAFSVSAFFPFETFSRVNSSTYFTFLEKKIIFIFDLNPHLSLLLSEQTPLLFINRQPLHFILRHLSKIYIITALSMNPRHDSTIHLHFPANLAGYSRNYFTDMCLFTSICPIILTFFCLFARIWAGI